MRMFTGCLLGLAAVVLAVGIALHYAQPPHVVFSVGVGTTLVALLVNDIRHGDFIATRRRERRKLATESAIGTASSEMANAPSIPPDGGSLARRCLECGQYNWPDAEECSWCHGQQLGPAHTRPSQFWAPTSFGGMFVYLALLCGAWVGALVLLAVIPRLMGADVAYSPRIALVRGVRTGVAIAVGVAGMIMIPLVAGLWRPIYALFPRHEDLVQVLIAAFITMLVGVAVGWFLLL